MNELTVEARLDNLEQVLQFIDSQLEQIDCPFGIQMKIDVAVEELFVNIANYAYAPGTGLAVIRFWVEENPKTIVITFTDSGMPYNPTEKEDPDTSLSAQDRQIGGLGIFMAKKSVDDMTYLRREGKNILSIRKSLP